MKSIYYAHCMALYDTPQEQRDIRKLEALGFIVLNPNTPTIQAQVADLKTRSRENAVWELFGALIEQCEAFAFRGLPDGMIPSGVAREIKMAQARSLPVIELPSATLRRTLTLDETLQYLKEVGQR